MRLAERLSRDGASKRPERTPTVRESFGEEEMNTVWTAQGRIAQYDDTHGFGKLQIERFQGSAPARTREIYPVSFHVSVVVKNPKDKRVNRLRLAIGTLVEFDAEPRGEGLGWRALAVRLIK